MHTASYRVGGHVFQVVFVTSDDDENLISSCQPFRCQPGTTPPLFTLTIDDEFRFATQGEEIRQFDCSDYNYGVYRLDDNSYQFLISSCEGRRICMLQCNSDFSRCTVSLSHSTDSSTRATGIQNSLMLVYAFAGAPYGTLLVHASVIRNAGTGYLFLGKSGTGKSTHTQLWLKHIPGSDLMNDDNPVVRIWPDGKTVVYGSPWSGKTPCYRNIDAPVGAFVRLKQKPENNIRRESPPYAFADVLPSVSIMKWDKRLWQHVTDAVSRIVHTVPVYKLGCLPNAEAALLCHRTLSQS